MLVCITIELMFYGMGSSLPLMPFTFMLISCIDGIDRVYLGCDVEARGIWTETPIPRVDTIDSAILYFNVRKFSYCTLLQLPPIERSSPANFLPRVWFMVGRHFSFAVCLLETMTANPMAKILCTELFAPSP